MAGTSQNACGSLNETQILTQIIHHSYPEFIPVRNATAGLDSYELMSILKSSRKRKSKAWDFTKYLPWTREENLAQHHLHPAEVFDLDSSESLAAESWSLNKIGEQNSVFSIQNTSELSAEFKPRSVNLAAVPDLSLKWKMDTTAPSIDLGNIYERKVTRSDMRKWLDAHEKAIIQKDLKELIYIANVYIIYHVLYSDKIVIRRGSRSGEKTLSAGPNSASATFQTSSADDVVTIRPDDIGIKPIAFKVAKLDICKLFWYKQDVRLVLSQQTPSSLAPRHALPACRTDIYDDDSQTDAAIRSQVLKYLLIEILLWIVAMISSNLRRAGMGNGQW